jgi:hypothetical protein
LALSVSERQNYSYAPLNITGLNFCNVNITYTHPGYNDTIHVQVWLPLKGWNQRFQGTGGSGFVTGVFDQALAPAVAQGYSAVSTDGGHELNVTSAAAWALVSPGNVDWNLLQDFASTALNDMTVLGKAVTKSYYGTAPKYSYWNGCSTGGRQGLMMAQRFPDAYDGILAAAPAINWPSFIVAEYWGQFMMNQLGVYPPQCEFDAITTAAVSACDALDGLVDGIIASPEKCHFNPHILVGKSFNCSSYSQRHIPLVRAQPRSPLLRPLEYHLLQSDRRLRSHPLHHLLRLDKAVDREEPQLQHYVHVLRRLRRNIPSIK